MKTDRTTAWTQLLNPKNEDKLTRNVLTEKYVAQKGWFPTTTRIFASTIAVDLVPIMPMSASSNLLFYIDVKFNNPNELTRSIITEKHLTKTRHLSSLDFGFRIE